MTTIVTSGRSDLETLFKSSGVLDGQLVHNPFLAFVADDGVVTVAIVSSAKELVSTYAPETPVMVQWPGRWRSDFFRCTVGEVMEARQSWLAENSCTACASQLRGWSTLTELGYSLDERFCHDCAKRLRP